MNKENYLETIKNRIALEKNILDNKGFILNKIKREEMYKRRLKTVDEIFAELQELNESFMINIFKNLKVCMVYKKKDYILLNFHEMTIVNKVLDLLKNNIESYYIVKFKERAGIYIIMEDKVAHVCQTLDLSIYLMYVKNIEGTVALFDNMTEEWYIEVDSEEQKIVKEEKKSITFTVNGICYDDIFIGNSVFCEEADTVEECIDKFVNNLSEKLTSIEIGYELSHYNDLFN